MEKKSVIITREKIGMSNFDILQKVVTAVSDDASRYFMSGLHAEDGKLVATDGKRMHIWEMPEPVDDEPLIPDGDWKIVSKDRKSVILEEWDNTFPNWKRVTPDIAGKESVLELDLNDVGVKSANAKHFSGQLYRLFDKTGACFNIGFLLDIKGRMWNVYGEAPDKGWTFLSDNLHVVIMPIQLPKEEEEEDADGED